MDSKDVLAFPNFDDRSFLARRSKAAQYNRTMVKIVISTGVKSWIDKTDMPVEWNGKKVLRWRSRGSSQLLRTGSNGNRLYL